MSDFPGYTTIPIEDAVCLRCKKPAGRPVFGHTWRCEHCNDWQPIAWEAEALELRDANRELRAALSECVAALDRWHLWSHETEQTDLWDAEDELALARAKAALEGQG